MKNLLVLFVFSFLITMTAYSQVTNLLVNGQTSNPTMASGDQLSWSYDVPVAGDTTLIVIWVDVDQNGILNPLVDVVWTYFNQVDGDPNGQGGPPDMDGIANGHVSFQQNLGLAPAHYIMTFENHNNTKSIATTVTNLASPTFTISGTVNVPNGLENTSNNGPETMWTALTDVDGNFSIKVNSDTSGNPHRVSTNNNSIFGSAIVSPQGYSIVLTPGTTSYTGNNFTVTASAASVTGTESGKF